MKRRGRGEGSIFKRSDGRWTAYVSTGAGERHRLRPGTWKRYEEYIRVHVVPRLGSVPLAKLSPQHLDRLYHDRVRHGLSTTTVLHIHRVIHRALEQAMRYGLVVRNVAKLVDAPLSRSTFTRTSRRRCSVRRRTRWTT